MATYNDVKLVSYSIDDEEITIIKNDNTPVTPKPKTDVGQTLQLKKSGDKWNLNITSGELSGNVTKIDSRRGNRNLLFNTLGAGDTIATMKFIGIDDIRDGALTGSEWYIAYTKTKVSIKTTGDKTTGRIIIQKAH